MIKNKFRSIVVISSLIALFFAGTCVAQETANIDVNKAEYTTGVIDRLSGEEIVIDDSLHKFAKGVQFLSRQGAKIETRWFKEGDKVRFVINNKNEAIIVRKL